MDREAIPGNIYEAKLDLPNHTKIENEQKPSASSRQQPTTHNDIRIDRRPSVVTPEKNKISYRRFLEIASIGTEERYTLITIVVS